LALVAQQPAAQAQLMLTVVIQYFQRLHQQVAARAEDMEPLPEQQVVLVALVVVVAFVKPHQEV
jgi:hypothetical protein